VACRFDAGSSEWSVTARAPEGALEEFRGEHLISSMPMRQLVAQIEPRLPENALTVGPIHSVTGISLLSG